MCLTSARISRPIEKVVSCAVLLLFLGLVTCFHFAGLAGGRFWELDEYRALEFQVDHTALFRLSYSLIGSFFGGEHAVYLFISSVLWCSSVIAVFFTAKANGADREAALAAGCLFAFSVTLSHFARSAYPVSLASFSLSLAVFALSASARNNTNHPYFVMLYAFFCALTALTYLSWYPAIGMLVACSLFLRSGMRKRLKDFALAAGSFCAFYIFGAALIARAAATDLWHWFARMDEIKGWGQTFVSKNPFHATVAAVGALFWNEALPLASAFILIVVVARARTIPHIAKVLVACSIVSILSASVMASLGYNTLYDRNLAGEIELLLIGLGIAFAVSFTNAGGKLKRSIRYSGLAFGILCTMNVYIHRRALLTIVPIVDWLTQHNATPAAVTSLVDISIHNGAEAITLPNTELMIPARPRIINWRDFMLLRAQAPSVRYLVLTDFYMLKMSGERDLNIWNGATPEATFLHPATGRDGIRLYDIEKLDAGHFLPN